MLLFLARIVPYTVALPSRPIARLLLHLTTLRGADYLFLSSRMQSALTSSPTHQDISGVKQYQYFRHAVQPETETETCLFNDILQTTQLRSMVG